MNYIANQSFLFTEIFNFLQNFASLGAADLEEISHHVADMSLIPTNTDELDHSELIGKLRILGMVEEGVSRLIAAWMDLKLKPDFILLATIFKNGNHNYPNLDKFEFR